MYRADFPVSVSHVTSVSFSPLPARGMVVPSSVLAFLSFALREYLEVQ